jgi:cell wall-associated NlpC family hydrolase
MGWINTGSTGGTSKTKSLADVAAKEIGTKGYDKNGNYPGDYTTYGDWIKNDGVPWCASFVSWCVNQAGVSTSVVPKTSSCAVMKNGSNSYCSWNSNSLKNIKRNDVIFFYNSRQGYHHVGIVSKVSGSKISVIEGNTGSAYGPDIVKEITYTVDSNTGEITKGYNGEYFKGYISVS